MQLFKRGIVAAGEGAVAADDYLLLKPIADFYTVQAQLKNLDTAANGLDPATVRSMIPLTVTLEILEKPEILDELETGQVHLRAGYRLVDKPVKFAPRVFAQLDLSGGEAPEPKLQQAAADSGLIGNNSCRRAP